MEEEYFLHRHPSVSADALFAAVVNSSDDAIISKDLSGTITGWNKGAERIFGYTADEVVGGPISVIIPPERGHEERMILDRLSRGERIEHFESVRVRKDGGRVDVSVTISPLRHEGKVIGGLKVARDITLHRQMERTAHQERTQLEVTLDSIGDAVIMTDVLGNVIFLNPVAEHLTGWKRAEASGQPLEAVFKIINEQTRRRADNPAIRALREGTVVALANHTLLLSRTGVEYAIDDTASPIRDSSGEVFGVVLVFRDVSDKRAAEDHRARLAAIVQSSDDAIISKDLTGKISSWNIGATRLFGYTAEEMLGRPISILIPPDRLEEEVDILSRLRRGERIEHFETVRITKDRRKVNVSLTVSPLLDSEGNVVGASKIARDITERKQTEHELQRARDRLERYSDELETTVTERTADLRDALAQLESFSYSISHDLRAPLRAINSFIGIVLNDHAESLKPEARALLERSMNSAARLSVLIEEVLSSAQLRVTLRPVHLSTLVPRVIDDYANLREHRDAIEVKQPLAAVLGSEPLLTQCISNLIGNALKFVPRDRAPHVELWTDFSGENVRLHVRDNGTGIPPEEQSRIFEMFSRGAKVQEIEGSGVGLAVVKRAVTRMGGQIGLSSIENVGSEFWIELPSAEATPRVSVA